MTCKRNAFVFLVNYATPKAVEYLLSVYDQVGGFDELMQLAVIELIRKDCKTETANRVRSKSQTGTNLTKNGVDIAKIYSPSIRTSQRTIALSQV